VKKSVATIYVFLLVCSSLYFFTPNNLFTTNVTAYPEGLLQVFGDNNNTEYYNFTEPGSITVYLNVSKFYYFTNSSALFVHAPDEIIIDRTHTIDYFSQNDFEDYSNINLPNPFIQLIEGETSGFLNSSTIPFEGRIMNVTPHVNYTGTMTYQIFLSDDDFDPELRLIS
jgi:hypothetical protein